MVDAKVVASLQLILLCVIIELNLNIYIDHHTNILQVRILVTHGIGFLPQCDVIVVMADGQITEVGTYTELCLLYTSPSPRDATLSRMPSSA